MSHHFPDSSSNSTDEHFWNLVDSESSEELEMLEMVALQKEQENMEGETSKHCGAVQCHAYIDSGRLQGHQRLYDDYFVENLKYSPTQF
ncbi:unnamed protein product [Prunus armeniaca]|uniref:Uncharacterized protein n=1 Tax=Prunus armeniaca TaxID=36596 RepID=A0A6J5X7T0_PRUAR|nr:unnamed protein product [Prunus armeniaca]CAB4308547.1 unnamed protein product [Prunus armeniaca]